MHTHKHTHAHTQTYTHTHTLGVNLPGRGNSIFLSILPGLIKAGSRLSIRFVAMITFNTRTNRIRISGRDIHGDQNLICKETVILVREEVRRADRNTDE